LPGPLHLPRIGDSRPSGANVARLAASLFLLLSAGCAGLPPGPVTASPCSVSEASYECQVERYHNVNVN
jgi:hypothetical protein